MFLYPLQHLISFNTTSNKSKFITKNLTVIIINIFTLCLSLPVKGACTDIGEGGINEAYWQRKY